MNRTNGRSKLSTVDCSNLDSMAYAEAVADLLAAHYGAGAGGQKRCARVTRASMNTVRNWFEGRNGPRGDHLLLLMADCEPLFEWVCHRAGRAERLDAIKRDEMLRKAADLFRGVEA